jgi:hypothetical protein
MKSLPLQVGKNRTTPHPEKKTKEEGWPERIYLTSTFSDNVLVRIT